MAIGLRLRLFAAPALVATQEQNIPLGTLADRATMNARRAAHAAFDPLWQNKGKGSRRKAYEALSKAMGKPSAHISWMDAAECLAVIKLVQSGHMQAYRRSHARTFPSGKTAF